MSKIYYSFQDMPFNQWDNNPIQPEKLFKFSRGEIIQILIAIGVLTIAFSFALTPTGLPLSNIPLALSNIPLAFLAIVTAFFCHELGHKFMGQRYGYWSEFRMFPMGLILALFLGLFAGFVFAAPGAVTIMGHPNKDEYGKISVIGPLINISLASIFYILAILTPAGISGIFVFIAFINAFLAFFNLLPFGPLDGMKVFNWRKEIWISLAVICILLLYLIWPLLYQF